MWRNALVIVILLACTSLKAQSPLTSNYFNYHLIDRTEIESGELNTHLFTGVKPFRRNAVALSVGQIDERSGVHNFNRNYLNADQPEFAQYGEVLQRKPILKSFYRMPNALYTLSYQGEDGKLQFSINPVLFMGGGIDQKDSVSPYVNSRGLVIRGQIGDKVGFFTQAMENQQRFLNYQRIDIENTDVVPEAGLHKPFGLLGEDYFNVRGYITFSPIKEIMVQFGHDQNFIGNGYRSLILSDQAKAYPFLKFNTKVWKINYMNLFMEHVDFNGESEGKSLSRKFSALHHFSINLGKNFTLGLFENIVFDRQDSTENNRYEIQYLNPIIFYRAVEHGLNSTDNAMLGLDWKWNFLKKFSFYGQFVFDEFVKNEFVKLSDNWVNKWAYQAGLKYVNIAGISNLDAQVEINQVRPYVYSHRFKSQNWAHYNQALAHPYGSNFRELIGIIRYQPYPRWNLELFLSSTLQGVDSTHKTNINGANILNSNSDILDKSNAPMFQGLEKRVQLVQLHSSYMIFHNLFIDLRVLQRSQDLAGLSQVENLYYSIGLRLNARRQKLY